MRHKNLFFLSFLLFLGYFSTLNAQSKYIKNRDINSLLEKKRQYNKHHGFGYRIQLYNGNETQARNIQNGFQKDFSGIYTKLQYISPEWKVQVGNYKTRLDADRALLKIRENFSGAIVISK